MQTIFDMKNFYNIKACVATIGNFDGVHLAHKKLIETCIQKAKEKKIPSVVITFEPHPSLFFSKKSNFHIIDIEQRIEYIRKLGADYLYILPFVEELAKQTAKDFIKNFLLEVLHCQELIIGYNFTMGSDKATSKELSYILTELNCKLFIQEEVKLHKKAQQSISSSLIRSELTDGNIEVVNSLLGYPYYISGIVEHGAKRGGTQLGFPTANITPADTQIIPKRGVYATTVFFPNKKENTTYKAITNIGYNPTFDGKKLIVETYILNFSENIYDECLHIAFLTYLREEKKFNSLQELIHALENDKKRREEIDI